MKNTVRFYRGLVFLIAFLSNLGLVAAPAGAARIRLDRIPLGKVIELNGQQFVKVGNDAVKGTHFVALKRVCYPGIFNGYDLQEFSAADCNCLPTPTGTNYTLAGTMTDSRDGKSYEVRKFADGKCWLVDNLAYGGVSDACVNKTTFDGNTAATPTHTFGAGTYGDCRNNPGFAGYLYNWQATMQHASAYYNNDYQPVEPAQGICPAGWHVPSTDATGYMTGDYQVLLVATNFADAEFWNGGNWKGTVAGNCDESGNLYNQGDGGLYWASRQSGEANAFFLSLSNLFVVTASSNSKDYGFTVRCVKDTVEKTMQNFTTADCAAYPTPSGKNYTKIGSLKDERDGKWYEIRKFADGKCWMVDNLKYGGPGDACAGKTTFDGSANLTDNAWGYGDCRSNASSATYGYLYNWQAAMQDENAYNGGVYAGPVTDVQGICPTGWHLPTGAAAGEYRALYTAAGSAGDFWRTGEVWKGVYSGYSENTGNVGEQGVTGYYWTSSQIGTSFAYFMYFDGSSNGTMENINKDYGFAIRCIKN